MSNEPQITSGFLRASDLVGDQPVISSPHHPVQILSTAGDTLKARAASRDAPEGERAMAATVNAFNALYGTNLTEEQGWMFMVFLKSSRAKGGAVQLDDYVDGAAYFALAGEAAVNARG